MKARHLLFVGIGLLLTGCIPLQQTEITGGLSATDGSHDYFGWYNETGYGLSSVGPGKVNTIRVIDAQSYALSSKGVRYGVHSQPHLFDIDQKYAYVRNEIHFLNAKGGPVSRLENGEWRFVFVFLDLTGKEERRVFTGKLWNFYYVPILDGAPN